MRYEARLEVERYNHMVSQLENAASDGCSTIRVSLISLTRLLLGWALMGYDPWEELNIFIESLPTP